MSAAQVLVDQVDALPYRERWQHMLRYGKDGAAANASADAVQQTISELAASSENGHKILAAMALRGLSAALPVNAALPDAVQQASTTLAMDLSPKVYKLVAGLVVQRTPSADALEALMHKATADQFKLLCETIDAQKSTQPLGMRALLSCAQRTDLSKRKRDLLTRHLSADALNQTFASTPLWMLPSDVLQKVVLHTPLWALPCLRKDLEAGIKTRVISSPLLRAVQLCLKTLAATGAKENVQMGMNLIRDVFHRLPVAKDTLRPTLEVYFNHATMDMIDYLLNGDGATLLPLHFGFSRKVRALVENSFALRCTLSERSVIAWGLSTQFSRGSAAFCEYIYTQRRDVIADSNTGRLDASTVQCLPNPADREREARQGYQTKVMEENPLQRMQYLTVLPFSEAVKLADEYVTSPTPDLRIAAVRQLVATAKYHPEEMDQILQMCVARGKEQDPFRLAMAEALSNLPTSVWRAPHEASVQAILTAAYAAKDVSDGTICVLKGVLLQIAVHHPEFAAKCLVELYTERPKLRNSQSQQWERLARKASPETVAKLYNAMRPMVDEWMANDVEAFYRFYRELPRAVVTILKDTLHPFFVQQLNLEDTDPSIRSNAGHRAWGYSQLESYFPDEARALSTSLLQKDATWFNTNSIKAHVVRDLQGPLLTPYLTPEPSKHPKGRPSLGEFRELAMFFYRMSPAQQHTYAQSLIEMVRVCDKDTHSQKRYLTTFPQIPSASLQDGIGALAVEDNENIFLRDWALVTLGRLHDKASFEELQRAMTDTRQREAVVPVMRRLQQISAADSIEVLRPALESKLIMVQKEVTRFIGDKSDPAAFECLRSFLESKGDKLQQDALLAVVRGLWNYMDQEVTWALLERTVSSPRAAACAAICKIPDRVLVEPWQRERYGALIVRCLTHQDNAVKIAAMERVAESPQLETPEVLACILPMVDHYKPGRVGGMAVNYLLNAATVPSQHVADKFVSTRNPRWLSTFVENVCDATSNHRRGQPGEEKVKEIARLMADQLIEQKRLSELACRLVFVLEPSAWMSYLTRMHTAGLVHPGCAKTAIDMAGQYYPYDDAFIAQITKLEAEHLRQHPEPFFRRVGLALLEKCASRNNWGSDDLAQALVQTYRKDADVWVRDTAELLEYPGDSKKHADEL